MSQTLELKPLNIENLPVPLYRGRLDTGDEYLLAHWGMIRRHFGNGECGDEADYALAHLFRAEASRRMGERLHGLTMVRADGAWIFVYRSEKQMLTRAEFSADDFPHFTTVPFQPRGAY